LRPKDNGEKRGGSFPFLFRATKTKKKRDVQVRVRKGNASKLASSSPTSNFNFRKLELGLEQASMDPYLGGRGKKEKQPNSNGKFRSMEKKKNESLFYLMENQNTGYFERKCVLFSRGEWEIHQ